MACCSRLSVKRYFNLLRAAAGADFDRHSKSSEFGGGVSRSLADVFPGARVRLWGELCRKLPSTAEWKPACIAASWQGFCGQAFPEWSAGPLLLRADGKRKHDAASGDSLSRRARTIARNV